MKHPKAIDHIRCAIHNALAGHGVYDLTNQEEIDCAYAVAQAMFRILQPIVDEAIGPAGDIIPDFVEIWDTIFASKESGVVLRSIYQTAG